MSRLNGRPVDVVVVGAGPVGLLAAIELTLGGARTLVLERLSAPSLVTKAMGMGPLGTEALQRRGMAGPISEAERRTATAMQSRQHQPPEQTNQSSLNAGGPRASGHFAGLTLIRAEAQREPGRHLRLVNQQATEAMLSERAHELGIEVRRGCEVRSVMQQAGGIDVEWASATETGRLRCSYLIGCDGGRSSVRKLAGFEFPGTPPTMTMYNVAAELDHPERLGPGGWQHTSGGMYSSFAGRLIMMDFSGPPTDREAPVTRDEVDEVLRRVSAADVHVTALEGGNRWTDNTRLAETYRRGQVFLAGDAAHIHSPFGGQGLSLGLVDAANLGWKLAAVIRGEMPGSLLDTYTAERRPVAEAVLANTLAQTAIMRPDPQSTAMRNVMAKLMGFDDVNRFIGKMMTGLATPYDLSSEQADVGRLLGDMPMDHADGNGSLYALMQDGRGVLLDASAGQEASKLVQASTRRVRCVAVKTGPSMLIRPDACLAWVGAERSTVGLKEALHCWFSPAPDDENAEPSENARMRKWSVETR